MCGIFGYFGNSQVSMQKVLKLLKILEVHQYEGEKRPVGGHGAGVCFANDSGDTTLYKVGKTNSSPAKNLSLVRDVSEASSRIILGHVRYAGQHLINTIK